jgi:membrane protein
MQDAAPAGRGRPRNPAAALARARRRLVFVVAEVVRQFAADGCFKESGALTYTTLFAVVPLLTVSYAVLSLLPGFGHVGGQMEAFFFEHFVPGRGAELQSRLDSFALQARHLTWLGIAVLYATALLMLLNVERVLNRIWRVVEPRHGFARVAVYWAVLTVGPPALAAIVTVSSYVASLPLFGVPGAAGMREGMLQVLPWLLAGSLLTLVYVAVPNCHVPLRHALAGGIVTTLAFRLAVDLFAIGLAGSSMQAIYGAFAAVPMFLAWIYVCWVLVLAGAILVRVLAMAGPSGAVREAQPLPLALGILGRLRDAYAAGAGLPDARLRSRGASPAASDRVVRQLHAAGYLVRSVRGDWRLGRDLAAVSVLDLCRALGVDPTRVVTDGGDGGELSRRLALVHEATQRHLALSVAAALEPPAAGTSTVAEVGPAADPQGNR